MKEKSLFRLADVALIAIFLIAIFSPLLLMVLGNYQQQSQSEKRALATLPAFPGTGEEWKQLPRLFEHYFGDHFGLRQVMVRCFSRMMVPLGAPPSDMVIVGKDGWLFFSDKEQRVIEGYRNIELLTQADLEMWKLHLWEKQQWLTEQGIAYIFVIAPDKHTIYSEYLPDRIRKVGTTSRYDQLVEYVRSGSDVAIVDLRPPLFEAKKQVQVYYRCDTHWNAIGASIAHYEVGKVLNAVYPHISPLKTELDEFVWQDNFTGDLSTMAALDNVSVERKPVYRPRENSNRKTDATFDKGETRPGKRLSLENLSDRIIVTTDSTSGITALVFGDSFAQAMAQFLPQYFSKTVFVWQHPDGAVFKKYVEAEKPDVVIEERVERSIRTIPRTVGSYRTDS